MRERERLARHAVLSAIAHGASLLPFVLWFVVAERLGPERFGLFSYALAFASLFETFADLGLRDYTVREVARDRSQLAMASTLLSWRLVLGAGTMLAIALAFELTRPQADARHILWLMAPLVALRALKHYLRGLLQAIGRFGLDTIVTLLDRTAMVTLGLAALYWQGSVLSVAVALLVARILDIGWTSWLVRSRVAIRPAWDWPTIRKAQIEAFPIGLFLMIVTVYAYADQVMIALLRDQVEVGLYSACYKIHEGFTLVPAILAAPTLPALSAMVATHPQRAADIARRVTKYALCAGFGLLLAAWFAARDLLLMVYGEAYVTAAPALVVLVAATVFTFSLWMINQVLIATARRTAMVKLVSFGLILNLVLNLVLIPRTGYLGAAWATLIGEGATLIASAWVASHALPGMRLATLALRPLVAVTGALVIGHIAQPRVNDFFAAALAVAAFLTLLPAIGVFDRTDREAVGSLFRRRRGDAPTGAVVDRDAGGDPR